MMMKRLITFVSLLLSCGSVAVASDFGTKEQSQDIAGQLSAIVQTGGVDAGIDAMHDPSQPFSTSTLGIHLFEDGIIVGDNREPELLAAAYTEVEDLTGEPMWPRIVAAADMRDDAMLEWYHYDTEVEYTYACYSEWAIEGTALIMVCR
ncbi:hypothetical protein [Yoonia sp. BS5-3]|uniref:Uncharacterized protein n=1 Tax=Yoonia phaeophyticola TaxID=3137369 RepID=A0ABZ2VAS7_9RHOB